MVEKPTYEELERRVQELEKLISDNFFKDSNLGMVGVSRSPSINDATELRKRAEEIVLKNTIPKLKDVELLSSEEIRQTFHELQVHQIELEMQNEELRRAQIELDAIRSRYFDLYDLAPIGYCTLSKNGLFLEVNLATSILFGMIRTDLIKQPITRFIHKEDQDIYYLHRKMLSDTGEPQVCELRMIKTDGGVFSVHIESTAAKEDDGTPVYRVLLSDITERKQAEVALQESKQFMTSLLKAIPLPIFFKDREGKYIVCNDTFTEIMGVTEEDIKGKTVYDLWPTEHAKEYHGRDLELIKNGVHQEYEFVVQDKNGRIRPVIYMKDVFHNTKGEVAGLVGAFLDITERKQTEDALKSNYALIQIAGETAKFGGWSVDLENNICTFSDAVADIHDVPHGYAPPVREAKNFYAPECREKVTQCFIACAKDGIPYDEEMEIITQKGKRVWVRTIGKAVKNEKDKIIKVQGSFQDITERKQVEAKILYLQKSESLNRMAGAIAHHFNNQLSVVMGNLELVLNDLPDDAENRENLFQAFEAGRKAAELSQQMLRYLGHISGSQTTINLSDVCRQSLVFLQSALPSGMTLNVDFPDSGPFVHADAGQIEQVLTNLFTNAQESLPNKQGIIDLIIQTVSHEDIPASRWFPLDWQPQDITYAYLEISDTGCGISKEAIVKIFDPFYTTKFTGRGMGLPVTVGILKTHGGCITVDNKPDSGCVFRVYLPVTTEKKPVKYEKVTTPKGDIGNDGTVLLIEDEASVRNMAKAMLTRLGYAVIEAKDGVEAMMLFQEHQNEIDCVLSDLTMPRMNGWETLTALREKGADVPVILASGYDKDTVMAGNHPELPQAFLNKPYSMAALKDVLMELIRL